jgi:hypothetical protein
MARVQRVQGLQHKWARLRFSIQLFNPKNREKKFPPNFFLRKMKKTIGNKVVPYMSLTFFSTEIAISECIERLQDGCQTNRDRGIATSHKCILYTYIFVFFTHVFLH